MTVANETHLYEAHCRIIGETHEAKELSEKPLTFARAQTIRAHLYRALEALASV
jgi:hypothetical protein